PTDYPLGPQQVDELLSVQSRGLTALEQALAEGNGVHAPLPEAPRLLRQDADQPLETEESVEPELQQKQESADAAIRPVERVKTKRPRGRIEEQPAGSEQTTASPPAAPSSIPRRDEPTKAAPASG